MSVNQIGLDTEKANQLSDKLNKLLADYQQFYMNVRGFHWNITGPEFFELHAKFEELYNDLLLKVDELAERIVTLGKTPLHAYSDYAKVSDVKEAKDISNGKEAVKAIVDTLSNILVQQRGISAFAGELDDEGTASQMSDYIKEQEKIIWMYNAYLGR
jgi:starvation-inducible DNA-binding protein